MVALRMVMSTASAFARAVFRALVLAVNTSVSVDWRTAMASARAVARAFCRTVVVLPLKVCALVMACSRACVNRLMSGAPR